MIDSLGLPAIRNFDDLAQHLRLSRNLVYWLASESPRKYCRHEIPKRDGTRREISAPVKSLKVVQRWVLSEILYKLKVSPYSYGFAKGKGSPLAQCAQKHRRNLYILKIDIRHFYPSIPRKKVYGLFVSIGYNSSAANLLTNICTYNGSLPQGAVTSACLANLICRNLDYRIAAYCNKREIVYTRYADDLTFSCDNRDTLRGIYRTVQKILEEEGYQINQGKTQFLSPKCRKRILGITINDGLVKAPKEMKRQVRAMIYQSIVLGNHLQDEKIKGYVAYIKSIEPKYDERVQRYCEKLSQMTAMEGGLEDKYNDFFELPDIPNFS